MKADSELIEWLLFDSGITMSDIIEGSGIARRTAYDLKSKETSIERMSFRNADLLTKYAIEIKNKLKEPEAEKL